MLHRSSRAPRSVARVAVVAVLVAAVAACGGGDESKVGLIGDSITDMSRQPLTTALGTDHVVEIVGKFGARSDEVIPDVKVIAASNPGAAIINIGTNDALQQVPADQTRANIQQILDLLEDTGCRFLVQINEGIADKATGTPRTEEARAVNAQLASLAEENDGVEVIDWNATIASNGGNGVVTYDTVHLSDKGVVLMADVYRTALDGC